MLLGGGGQGSSWKGAGTQERRGHITEATHWNPGREESEDVGEDTAVDRRSEKACRLLGAGLYFTDATGFLEGGGAISRKSCEGQGRYLPRPLSLVMWGGGSEK